MDIEPQEFTNCNCAKSYWLPKLDPNINFENPLRGRFKQLKIIAIIWKYSTLDSSTE